MSGHVWTCPCMSWISWIFVSTSSLMGVTVMAENTPWMQSIRSQIAWKSSSKKVSPCDKAMEQLHLFGNI